jgi:hypothetical protein
MAYKSFHTEGELILEEKSHSINRELNRVVNTASSRGDLADWA